jgi:predicted dienelactone hydrolase
MQRFFTIALVALYGVLLIGCGDDDSSDGPPLTSAQLLRRGPVGVGSTTLIFVDASRPTMANGDQPEQPTRSLVTEIWYPTDSSLPGATTEEVVDAPLQRAGRAPLIVYSHGFMDTRFGPTYLARHLASYGYVVAAPDFPLSNRNAAGGPNARDLVNQPGDVHFLIDQLLALDADRSSRFAGAIDYDRIALSGLSLGGSTTFLATFHPRLRDSRIKAAAPIAGGACLFTKRFYGDRDIPLLIMHGSLDAIVPYAANALFGFAQAKSPKYLATLVNGSHTAFTTGADVLFETQRNPDDVGCNALRGTVRGGPELIERLGGEADGIVAAACRPACEDPLPRPEAMRPTRQLALERLTLLAFFEAVLREDGHARVFLEQTLASENPDITIDVAR